MLWCQSSDQLLEQSISQCVVLTLGEPSILSPAHFSLCLGIDSKKALEAKY